MLSFLESSLPLLHSKGRLNLGQDIVHVYERAVSNTDEVQKQNSAMIMSGALAALLQIFDTSSM